MIKSILKMCFWSVNLSIVSCHQSSTTGSLFALMFITMRQLHLLLVNYLNLSKLTSKNSINAIDAWNKAQTSITYLFSFPRYQTKCVSKFLFSQLMSQTIRFMLDQTLKQMADRKKKRGRWKYKNLNISRMKIAF